MEPKKLDKVSDGPSNQTRRQALMKFARYAAVAPTVMVLLHPHESAAGKHGGGRHGGRHGGRRGWRDWGWRGGRRKGGYRNPY